MAAYAALVSLLNIMEQIQNHPRHLFSLDKQQIESLQEKVGFLLDFIESCSHGGIKEKEALEREIAASAYEAEDVIESHVVDQIHAGSSTLDGKTSSCFLVDLQKVIEDMDSMKKIALKVQAQRGVRDQLPTYKNPAANSPSPLATGKSTMVGFDDYLIQLMDVLTGQQSNRQIIPIVGMGGIGKTTLARNVYEHLLIVQHFDVRLWATISQEYHVKGILSKLLSCERNPTDEAVNELGEQLHKSLYDKRYLIILDDMWSVEVWDKIKFLFPHNSNGSRVVVTSRQFDAIDHWGSSRIALNLLDEGKSWDLFCDIAFLGQAGCPNELEEVGKKIVRKCNGLPLAIAVVGGHLRKSSMMQEYWENIANDLNSISDMGEQCLNILSLSYNFLPSHLKSCFLYMGVFPEDEEIFVSELIKLWVAEGFLRQNKGRSMEEDAEDYLKDLISVRKWSQNGKIESCGIHDLLRELCLNVGEKQNFLCVLDPRREMHKGRRIVTHKEIPEEKDDPEIFHALRSARLVRSLKCQGGRLSFDDMGLLRVVDRVYGEMVNEDDDGGFVDAISRQLNLRYVCASIFRARYVSSYSLYLPSSISRLWNLQTLVLGGECAQVIAPPEIWEMPQLRHLEFNLVYLPDPQRLGQGDDDGFVLRNLRTLKKVDNLRLSEEVCRRIPNVRELELCYDDSPEECEVKAYYCPNNLSRFHKLESVSCVFDTDTSHFPILENLVLESASMLAEIPSGIGEVPTLRRINLEDCSVSAAISAMRILVEQEDLGNQDLQLDVLISDSDDQESFAQMMDEEGLASDNFRFHRY